MTRLIETDALTIDIALQDPHSQAGTHVDTTAISNEVEALIDSRVSIIIAAVANFEHRLILATKSIVSTCDRRPSVSCPGRAAGGDSGI